MSAPLNQDNYLPDVKQQYEDYPYPLRNPEQERVKLYSTTLDFLDRINYNGFGGKCNFHENFRALVAGGGTGDAVIFLAEQLRHTNAEIVYVDLSSASMNIAKERAKVRGLSNIQWHQASLLDVATLGVGEFDYINCSGVLHHLADPDAGLAALKSVLSDRGMMGIMVYAKYGRSAVYQVQNMLKLIDGDSPIEKRIANSKAILARLPQTNWYGHCHQWFDDIRLFKDIGLYDLLLHSQDRAYTVPELYEYVEKQGLTILDFINSHEYKVAQYIKDEGLKEKIANKDPKNRYAIGELFNGNVTRHICHISKNPVNVPSTDDLDMVPALASYVEGAAYKKIYESAQNADGKAIPFTHTSGRALVPYSKELVACLKHMDGTHSFGDIYELANKAGEFENASLQKAFSECCKTLISLQLLYLRHKSTPAYRTLEQINNDMKQRG